MPNGDGTVRVPLADPKASVRQVVAALANAQKSNRNAPAYSRWVNRPIGRVFAAVAFKLGLTPNQVTMLSAIFTFSGVGVVAAGSPALGWLVALLLVIGYALDSADGQLARLRGGGSASGEWLDHFFDALKAASLHVAVAIMWWRNLGSFPEWSLLVPLAFTIVASVYFFGMVLTEILLRRAGPAATTAPGGERAPVLMSLIALVNDYGLICVSMFLMPWFDAWRWVYAVLMVGNLLLLAIQSLRWYRRIVAAG